MQEQPVILLDCERSYIPTGTHPPYRTLKAWMVSTYFLTGILNQVSTDMSLHMLACNLKPLKNTPGIKPLLHALQAWCLYLLLIKSALRAVLAPL
jgi:hypothetical protein